MLQPKRMKFRKMQKGRNRGLAERGSKVSFGEFALKATGRGRMTARQIEAARRTITRRVKRGGKLWIRVFPDKPITQKPLEVRQGKGKGSVEYWVCQIQPGRVLYEIEGVSEEVAREAFTLAASKLPFKTPTPAAKARPAIHAAIFFIFIRKYSFIFIMNTKFALTNLILCHPRSQNIICTLFHQQSLPGIKNI